MQLPSEIQLLSEIQLRFKLTPAELLLDCHRTAPAVVFQIIMLKTIDGLTVSVTDFGTFLVQFTFN